MRRAIAKARGLSVAVKLSVLVLTCVGAIFIGAFKYNYSVSRQIVLKNVELSARNLTQSTANHVASLLAPLETISNYICLNLETSKPSAEDLQHLVRQAIESTPAIFGVAIAFEPGSFAGADQYAECYGYREGGNTQVQMYGDDSQDDHSTDWYMIPQHLESPAWSEPYFDEGGGNITMATYSAPFYRQNNGAREFWGVNAIDISLEWLHGIVSDVSLYKGSYAFIVSANGVFLSHPSPDFIMRESIFSQAEEHANAPMRRAGRSMVRGESGFVRVNDFRRNQPCWLYYAPLAKTGWSLGVIVPEAVLFSDIVALERRVLVIVGLCLSLLMLVIIALSMRITKPLRELSSLTSEIARGNLDIALPPVLSADEVGKLSRSFEEMRVALKEYIADLTQTTAAKERIESELKIARHIQMSFLPRHFPSFNERSQFDLHALLEPAKEVGGDLYDFFMLDDDHLFISVGDVSGKGVPAALLMAVTKTLVKGVAEQRLELADVLRKVNIELCRDNDSMMFVTLFCAIIDLRTGEMHYASAGHNPPLLVSAQGEARWLEQPQGLVLGVDEEAVFGGIMTRLNEGDALVAYTDGVTEAMNEAGAFFGEQRLLDAGCSLMAAKAEGVVNNILQCVRSFAGDADQSDDITVLVLKYLKRTEQ